MGYISRKAKVEGRVSENAVILGPTSIGSGTLIDKWVYVGYPSRPRLLKAASTSPPEMDEVSLGANIGRRCVIRSLSTIYDGVEIGDEVELGHGVLVRSGSRIGARSRIGSFSQLDGAVHVGEGVLIQSLVYLPHLTIVEDGVFIGPNVVVTNDRYPVGPLTRVKIGRRAIIGANATLLAGITVGEEAVVAAGSIVTRDIPSSTVVKGAPAKPYMTRREYEEKRSLR